MNKNLKEINQALKNQSPIPYLLNNGYKIDEIKGQIIDDLTPFFEDKNSLEENSLLYLVSDWINLSMIKIKFHGIEHDIKLVIENYKQAKETNFPILTKAMQDLFPDYIQAGNKYWSILHLELNKSTLEIEEFIHASFKDLLDIIEGLMKTFIIEIVIVNRIIRGKPISVNEIKNLKLGNLIDELINNSPLSTLFTTKPDNIKFSDWRNIAAHQNYSTLQNGKIECKYGTPNNRRVFTISREELFDRVSQCSRTLEVLNICHKFFGFDNYDKLKLEISSEVKSAGRNEMWYLMFASSAISQGFEVQELEFDEKVSKFVMLDLIEENPLKRGIHATLFIYNLWCMTNSAKIVMNYKKKDGQIFLSAECEEQVFWEIAKGNQPIDYLAEKMKLSIIS
ncbi:MAG: hypothetical protein KDE33_21470 [Bacteroidetes bacterium]|nr:hypothetical protein [Bacteroidota bacterium]